MSSLLLLNTLGRLRVYTKGRRKTLLNSVIPYKRIDNPEKTYITRIEMYYSDDRVLEEFYKNLLSTKDPSRIHIPMSDVFYVREALRLKTGVTYSLDHVERAMYLEGHLKRRDVFEPERKRDWE